MFSTSINTLTYGYYAYSAENASERQALCLRRLAISNDGHGGAPRQLKSILILKLHMPSCVAILIFKQSSKFWQFKNMCLDVLGIGRRRLDIEGPAD